MNELSWNMIGNNSSKSIYADDCKLKEVFIMAIKACIFLHSQDSMKMSLLKHLMLFLEPLYPLGDRIG